MRTGDYCYTPVTAGGDGGTGAGEKGGESDIVFSLSNGGGTSGGGSGSGRGSGREQSGSGSELGGCLLCLGSFATLAPLGLGFLHGEHLRSYGRRSLTQVVEMRITALAARAV